MIAGRPFELAVATDPDAMLIDACERQDAGEQGVIDPFWATTWRAAAGLDTFLNRIAIDGVRVLEVGCGTGHAGIAAHLRGGEVTITDGVDDPLELVRRSIKPLERKPAVARLRFGEDVLEAGAFEVLLGSDVTYLRELWPVLLETAEHHLAPGGVMYLSDPHRTIADEFRMWVAGESWSYREHRVELADDPRHPIRVMELRRR